MELTPMCVHMLLKRLLVNNRVKYTKYCPKIDILLIYQFICTREIPRQL